MLKIPEIDNEDSKNSSLKDSKHEFTPNSRDPKMIKINLGKNQRYREMDPTYTETILDDHRALETGRSTHR
jgi:hypothetical protein